MPTINRFFIGLLCLVSFLSLAFFHGLQADDASMYALVVKNAILFKQWLLPQITPGDVHSFLDKPPLGIWLIGLPSSIFGFNLFTLHLSNVLYFWTFMAAVYFFIARYIGSRFAWFTSVLFSCCLVLVIYSRTPKLDILIILFVALAHFALFRYLITQRATYLYQLSMWTALGFLTKSGFALVLICLTIMGLLLTHPQSRNTLIRSLKTRALWFSALLFILGIGGVFLVQGLQHPDLFIDYFESLLFRSKYNTSYLGLGLSWGLIPLLFVSLLPWSVTLFATPLFRRPSPKLTLYFFCQVWFGSSFLFFFFLYRQVDFRSLTLIVPPLLLMISIMWRTHRHASPRLLPILSGVFGILLLIYSLILFGQGEPFFIWTLGLLLGLTQLVLCLYFWVHKPIIWQALLVTVLAFYSALFCFNDRLIQHLTPISDWPTLVNSYQEKGYSLVIFRPHDRPLFMRNDLSYTDVMSGPADLYVWSYPDLDNKMPKQKWILLTNPESWEKLSIKGQVLLERPDAVLVRSDD